MTLEVGTYSQNTLRHEDIAQTLRDMLMSQEHDESDTIVKELEAIAEDEGRDTCHDSDVICDAMDILQEYAPAFCYVGFHEGNGSDLGVWFDSCAFEESCQAGDILKVSDLSEIDAMPVAEVAAHTYITTVNDHGNITIYPVKATVGEEILSIV